jgi:response regulator NasT
MITSRLLIADDDVHVRANLREMLEDLGYLVVGEAGDGEQAISMARQLRPDVVLTDIKMPYKDGIEVARVLRDEQVAPVILTTSYSSREMAIQACQAGVLGYLLKPIHESELMPIIEVARDRWNDHWKRKEELNDLREQIETRTVIENAKEYLMQHQGLRESDAFRKIQRMAMNNRRSMREVAQALLLAQQL